MSETETRLQPMIERAAQVRDLSRNLFLRLTLRTTPAGEESRLNGFLSGWERDDAGNARITIPWSDGSVPTHGLCAHLDDVSKESRIIERRISTENGRTLVHSEHGSILGADDKAGVAIILALVAHNVPGQYYLFTGEEQGLTGSRHAAASGWGTELEILIALDRKGRRDLVHTQLNVRCCSDEFAKALCASINNTGMDYWPIKGGSTDSAPFMGIVKECSNISVGYESAHGNEEVQDLTHLGNLASALSLVDWSTIPRVRVPSPCPEKRAPMKLADQLLAKQAEKQTSESSAKTGNVAKWGSTQNKAAHTSPPQAHLHRQPADGGTPQKHAPEPLYGKAALQLISQRSALNTLRENLQTIYQNDPLLIVRLFRDSLTTAMRNGTLCEETSQRGFTDQAVAILKKNDSLTALYIMREEGLTWQIENLIKAIDGERIIWVRGLGQSIQIEAQMLERKFSRAQESIHLAVSTKLRYRLTEHIQNYPTAIAEMMCLLRPKLIEQNFVEIVHKNAINIGQEITHIAVTAREPSLLWHAEIADRRSYLRREPYTAESTHIMA